MNGRDEAAAERPRPPQPSDQIGKYRIVELLGKGAMGAVYRAFDPSLERDVAIKVMLPQLAGDPEQKQRFEREARAVARMMHPNVVTVFDLGYHTDGSPYIVMQLLEGRDLLRILQKGPPLSLETKISFSVQVLEGLGHAHRVGIVHRDIKPANVFITDDQIAKITDFGIARLSAASETAKGIVLGTANYMSPEQVFERPLDGRSDLFSVGCMLCELVSGHRPFEGESMLATLYRIGHEEPSIALPVGPELEGLRPILERSLAKDPEQRYATAKEFAAALLGFLARSAGPDREVAIPDLETPPGAASGAAAPGTEKAEDRTRDIRSTLLKRPGLAVPTSEIAREALARPRADPTGLFRLLREIYVGGKSGHLHFTHGREFRSLRILSGQIIHGSSDVEGEHLGDVLVRYGLLRQADLEKAIRIVLRDRRRLGAVLSELGLIQRSRLEEAVGLHVREILFSVLDRADGTYAFEELSESLLDADLSSNLSTGEVILQATRRIQDPELVRRSLGDMDRVLALSADPLLRSQRITLTAVDGFILSRIDGTLAAREILSLVPLPPEDAERSLFSLLCTGTIDYLSPAGTGRWSRGTARTDG